MELDKKAVKILNNVYWTKGWTNSFVMPPPQDFEYAKSKGVMFDRVKTPHDECVERIKNAEEKISIERTAEAFLCSLSTRQVYLRSAICSRTFAESLKRHKYTGDRLYCLECAENGLNGYANSDESYIDMTDPNLLNFHRVKWGGGGIMTFINYIMLDLEQFLKLGELVPTKEDIEIFKKIIEACESCAPNDAATQLKQKLKGLFPANDPERATVIEILAYIGILEAKEERERRGAKNDWSGPAVSWRGEDKINRENLKKYFGKYIA